MPPKTVKGTPDQWQRVADAVVARRNAMGYRSSDLADSTEGLSTSVISLIENNRQTSYAMRTLAALCRALAWSPDSIHRILNGGEPEPLEEAFEDSERTLGVMRANVALLPRQLRDRPDDVALLRLHSQMMKTRADLESVNHRLTVIEQRLSRLGGQATETNEAFAGNPVVRLAAERPDLDVGVDESSETHAVGEVEPEQDEP